MASPVIARGVREPMCHICVTYGRLWSLGGWLMIVTVRRRKIGRSETAGGEIIMPPRLHDLSNQYESTVKVLAVTNVYTEEAYRTLKSDFSQNGVMLAAAGRWGPWR